MWKSYSKLPPSAGSSIGASGGDCDGADQTRHRPPSLRSKKFPLLPRGIGMAEQWSGMEQKSPWPHRPVLAWALAPRVEHERSVRVWRPL
jgi:hypothetical protein